MTSKILNQEIKKGFQNEKCFLCAINEINDHYYGVICHEKKKKYLIILDTSSELGNPYAHGIMCQNNEIQSIYLGNGLQKDNINCKTFTIELLKTLSKDNFKIADSLIEFYEKNKKENFFGITNEFWKDYKNLVKLKNKEKKDGKKEEYVDIPSLMEVMSSLDKFGAFIQLCQSGLTKEDFQKEGMPTILKCVPNDTFKKWEYAGTILQLSQSLSKQLGEFKDTKVGKKKVTLEDRADLYKAKASDIEAIDKNDRIKDADEDKFYSTKILFKKKEYQNISNGKTKYLGTENLLNKNAKMYKEFSKKLQTKQEKGGINF